MRKTIIPNKLNHKPQGYAKKFKKESEEKTNARQNILQLKD